MNVNVFYFFFAIELPLMIRTANFLQVFTATEYILCALSSKYFLGTSMTLQGKVLFYDAYIILSDFMLYMLFTVLLFTCV